MRSRSHRQSGARDRRTQTGRPSAPALNRLATIVRGADTARLDLAPQAAGLAAFSLGLSAIYQDDLEMLEKGMILYDALYSWCLNASDETHSWTGKAVGTK